LVRQNLRFTPNQLQAIDTERRIADYRDVPSRAALIRALIDAGMAALCAHSGRLVSSRTGHAVPVRLGNGTH
jgi:hypothetical protein